MYQEFLTYLSPEPESSADEGDEQTHEAHPDTMDTTGSRYPRREHHIPSYYRPGSAHVAKTLANLSNRLQNPLNLEEALSQPYPEDWQKDAAKACEIELLAEHGT